MKIIIHDLDEKELEKIYNLTGINKNENIILIFDNKKLKIVQVVFSVGLKIQVNVE